LFAAPRRIMTIDGRMGGDELPTVERL